MSDIIRVFRIIEYVGFREHIERQLESSLHGTRSGCGSVRITATTLGTFSEIMARCSTPPDPIAAALDKEASDATS